MARSIPDIKKTMTDNWIADPTIISKYGLDISKTFEDQFSKVSIENILFFVVAASIWIIEVLFDQHKAEVDTAIKTMRPHNIDWYRIKALAFQFGYELSEVTGEYDNTNLTEDEIASSKIITKCSVNKTSSIKPTIQVKVATNAGALTSEQKTAFDAYMNKIADAGVYVIIITGTPDILQLSLKIFYNPLVMDSNGISFIGGLKPVETAVKNHLKELKFNGNYTNTFLVDALQLIDGVELPVVIQSKASPYGNTPIAFTEIYNPLSGAIDINIETDLNILYEPI